MKKVNIYTDGACKGNPGPGGYGAILVYNGKEKELSGGEKLTTNNRMELLGAICALEALKEPCAVVLTSDSKYLVDAIQKDWLSGWIRSDFRRGKPNEVKNIELWKRLSPLLVKHSVTFVWVKGHAGHPYNERCDRLAVFEAEKFI
ncbi:MAG TPA: ribonuclease HI [Bacillota bacterium]|nr:ribonuclease HI [Bacillota bacterium]